jgi:hypothetical protein
MRKSLNCLEHTFSRSMDAENAAYKGSEGNETALLQIGTN